MVGTSTATCLPAEHGEERGAHRHLGLAEADVAADQAVHRLRALQVGEHVVDGALLVRRLLEREARLELLEEAVGPAVRRAAVRLARGVDLQQLLRHGEDRLRVFALTRSHDVPPSLSSAGAAPSALT